jgi:hypothetical protein
MPVRLRRCRVPAHAVDEQREETVGELVGVAAGLQPGVRPVRRREEEQCRRRVVEIGAEVAEVAPLAQELADPLFVASPLGDELLAPGALEVAPLLDEYGGNVELLRDDAQVAAERRADLVDGGRSSGIPSSAAWKAAAPSCSVSQSRSSFEAMCE